MNIGRAHPVGIDDDLVDQFDQFIVGGGTDIIQRDPGFFLIPTQIGEQVIHRGFVRRKATGTVDS